MAIVALAVLASSCASSKDKNVAQETAEDAFAIVSVEEHEAALRSRVAAEMRSAHRRAGEGRGKIIFKKPYFYKEYFEYPGASNEFTLEFRQRESRTMPMAAEVKVEKLRYATRLHNKRDAARVDEDFLRGTGTETVTYELRSGRWRQVGTLFLARDTEELVNGSWQPVQDAPTPLFGLEEEEPKGWLKRLMFWK